MAVKQRKPTSPGRRFQSVSSRDGVSKNKRPEKALTKAKSKSGGRNVHGQNTARRRGGGYKLLLRVIDFRRDKDGIQAKVAAIEYDPGRSGHIALLHYADGEKRYILAPDGLLQGGRVMSGVGAEIKPGNALPLRNI